MPAQMNDMKQCKYCGKEQEEVVAVCDGCGTTEFRTPSPPPPAGTDPGPAPVELWTGNPLNDAVHLFRLVIILWTVGYLVWFFHLLLGQRFISEEAWDALAWTGFNAWLPMPSSVAWLFLLLSVSLAVGLWFFSKSARLVFAAMSTFWLFASLLGGIQVQLPVGAYLQSLVNLASGAILVLAFTPPLKHRFV